MMKIERLDRDTFLTKKYMIYNSMNKGFTCECLNYIFNLKDDGTSVECKHIREIKEKYNL